MTALLLLQQAPAPTGLAQLANAAFPFLMLVGLSWFLLFRPMMKEKKEKQEMRDSLKSGDRIVTIGGIHGVVTKMGERTIHVRVADGVQIELSRTAVATIDAADKD